jgi:hypothetical protein
MRACATANALVAGAFLLALSFAACSNGSTPSQPPSAPDSPAPVLTTTVAPIGPPVVPEGTPAKRVPATPEDCKQLVSDITNDPPAGGVPLNNAQTSKDAGATDRLEPLTDLVRSKRDAFRCCFDLWARQHPGAQGSMKMVLKLKPDGTLTDVSFADTANRVQAPEVESCMGDLAKSLSFPRSPSGKETTFTYPFDFKARH